MIQILYSLGFNVAVHTPPTINQIFKNIDFIRKKRAFHNVVDLNYTFYMKHTWTYELCLIPSNLISHLFHAY